MCTRMLLVIGLLDLVCGLALAEIFSIDPRATYLRTNQDSAQDATPFSLAEMSLLPGDFIRLRQYGDFKAGTILSDTSTGMIAVFSGGNVLLASNLLHRVQDAIDAGVDYTTSVTYHGSVDTDIPEDFRVSDTLVQIPQGATCLFVTAADSMYYDNRDPDGDFAVGITLCTCPIGDLDFNCTVDLGDFSILASQWHDSPADISADLYPEPAGDGFVNILDLLILAENWLAPPHCEGLPVLPN
jgi:hypothetical protein